MTKKYILKKLEIASQKYKKILKNIKRKTALIVINIDQKDAFYSLPPLSKAIHELKRTSAKYIIVSVPREPLWRILNMFRGKYLRCLGNTPGHINHWHSNSIINLLDNNFTIKRILKPIPWTMILAEKK